MVCVLFFFVSAVGKGDMISHSINQTVCCEKSESLSEFRMSIRKKYMKKLIRTTMLLTMMRNRIFLL